MIWILKTWNVCLQIPLFHCSFKKPLLIALNLKTLNHINHIHIKCTSHVDNTHTCNLSQVETFIFRFETFQAI